MRVYRKYYSNGQEIDECIAQQLRVAIKSKDNDVVDIILESKQYNIFELFNDDTIEIAFQNMCQLSSGSDMCHMLTLLPKENGDYKNRAVQYIAKYDSTSILRGLLRVNYLNADEEYGYKCTLLHYATLRGFPKLVIMLLSKEADVCAVNKWGRTPLYYADKFKHEDSLDTEKFEHKDIVNLLCYVHQQDCLNRLVPLEEGLEDKTFSEEEVNWLRNSCPYSLNFFAI